MARNASNLLNRASGYSASMDASGNMLGSGVTGSYVQVGAVRIYGFSTAITANTTTTSAPAGSMAFTTNATGRGRLFFSDATKWQSGLAEDTTE